MTFPSDVSRLFQAIGLESFPYREFKGSNEHDPDLSGDRERWAKSLAILRREFEKASAAQTRVTQEAEQPARSTEPAVPPDGRRPAPRSEPAPARRASQSDAPLFPDTERPQLKRLFQRAPSATPQERALSEIFARLS